MISQGYAFDHFAMEVFFIYFLFFMYLCYFCVFTYVWIGNFGSWQAEMGLKKELREMLPIIIYKESFSIKDTQ